VSANNGVIRIGRKGIVKFAFGENGTPFDVDVVVAFQEWIAIDESLRQTEGEHEGQVLTEDMPAYHRAAVDFAKRLGADADITTAEALDFKARLSEQYDELAHFFRPKKRAEAESPGTSEVELRFSVEPETSPTSTN
jgi:hypothetical protein